MSTQSGNIFTTKKKKNSLAVLKKVDKLKKDDKERSEN